jgi:poly(hydroxyalkanoate) depolymerase family esterase
MLHGCTQEATDFSIGTAMNKLARDTGYAVLYPSQNTASNPNRCWNWFQPAHQQRGAGEPALLSALTKSVCAQHGLNPARIFVAGLSAGGAMALILAEEFPEVYAGVGVHSGLATGMANSTAQALRAMAGSGVPSPLNPAIVHRPTMVIHGDQDRTVHPHNAGLIVERCLAGYRQHHDAEKLLYQCHDEPVGGQVVKRHEYRSHDGMVVCRHWQLGSVGHAWSGGDARGSHTAVGGMCASRSLLSFFDQCKSLDG